MTPITKYQRKKVSKTRSLLVSFMNSRELYDPVNLEGGESLVLARFNLKSTFWPNRSNNIYYLK